MFHLAVFVPPEQLIPVINGQLLRRITEEVVHRFGELVDQTLAHEHRFIVHLIAVRKPVPVRLIIKLFILETFQQFN